MERFWLWVIEPLLTLAEPEVVVEVGSESGRTTRRLLEFAAKHGATVHAIDPEPRFDVDAWQDEFGERFRCHRMASLNALEQVGPADVVLLDGDHNWYSVFHELKLLEDLARRHDHGFPLVLLHDVGWPYARRDLYYHPERIPDAYRKPFAKQGLQLDSPELASEGGFNPHLFHSIYENRLQNGVLTAVEDFCQAASEKFDFVAVHGFHGLGILVPKALRETNDALSEWIEGIETTLVHGGYLEALERSRLKAEIANQQRKRRLEQLKERHREEADRQAELTSRLNTQTARTGELENRLEAQTRRLEEEARRVGSLHQQLEAGRRQIENLLEEQTRRVAKLESLDQSEQGKAAAERELASCRGRLTRSLAELEAAQGAARRLEGQVRQQGTQLEALGRGIEQLESAVAALLATRRWRVGDLLARGWHRLHARRPLPPAPVTVLGTSFGRLQRQQRDQAKACAPQPVPQAPARKPITHQPAAALTSPKWHSPRQRRTESFRVLFLLPVKGGGGGAHSVVQEVWGMRQQGVEARVAIESRNHLAYYRNYPELAKSDELFLVFEDLDQLRQQAGGFDIVIGTAYNSVELIKALVDENPTLLPAYYVQDYEPRFFPEHSTNWRRAYDSYGLVPDMVLFAKTRWLCNIVAAEHGVTVEKVSPSLDRKVFHTQGRASHKGFPVRIAAMIRPRTPRRAPERTLRVLHRIKSKFGEQVEIHLFGCSDEELPLHPLDRGSAVINHGVLIREQVADFERKTDLFVDLSDYQAFGRTALEAMACGCAAVVPLAGGANEYAVDRRTARVVDTTSELDCYDAICELIAERPLREKIQQNGLRKAAEYSIERAVDSELAVLRKHWIACQRRLEDEVPLAPRSVEAPLLKPSPRLLERLRRHRPAATQQFGASVEPL